MIWLPIVGNYADIDVYASILAYENLLNQRGKPAQNYIPVAPNYSVPPDLRIPELEHKTFDFNPTADQVIILDISKPELIYKFANDEQILEVIDHHPGYEEYWQEHIGKRAIIEPIGAVATSIFEWWVNVGIIAKCLPKSPNFCLAPSWTIPSILMPISLPCATTRPR